MTGVGRVGAHGVLRQELAGVFDQSAESTDVEPIVGAPIQVLTYPFESSHSDVHPLDDYASADPTVRALFAYYLEHSPHSNRHLFRALQTSDRAIDSNRSFRYAVFSPKRAPDAEGFSNAIVLMHGLNERFWSKYLPWAARLAELRQAPVILFPIAFHMNRAPDVWARPREMIGVARERQTLFPGLASSSFANVALSHRVQFAPHRFVTSGLQTYLDLIDLCRAIRDGAHPGIAEGARVDLFGYSIGCLLVQMLMMANPDGLFGSSRAALFCGGSILEHARPVSKAIVDEEAHRGLTHYLERLARDPATTLGSIFDAADRHADVSLFTSLAFAGCRRDARESAVRTIRDRMVVLGMARDRVFPPESLHASWGDDGESLLPTRIYDPGFDYSHEQPFPSGDEDGRVGSFFDRVFADAADALA